MICERHPLLGEQDGDVCPECQGISESLRRVVMDRLQNDMLPLSVSPGELFDRYTILLLKCRKVRDPDKAKRAQAEARAIRCFIYGGDTVVELPAIDAYVLGLENVNEQLWNIEDEIRALDSEVFPLEQYGNMDCLPDKLERYVELARSVYVTNDERSRIKAIIDQACGHRAEVKQYSEYQA